MSIFAVDSTAAYRSTAGGGATDGRQSITKGKDDRVGVSRTAESAFNARQPNLEFRLLRYSVRQLEGAGTRVCADQPVARKSHVINYEDLIAVAGIVEIHVTAVIIRAIPTLPKQGAIFVEALEEVLRPAIAWSQVANEETGGAWRQ